MNGDEVPHGGVDPELQVSTEHRAIERTLERARGVSATAHGAHALETEVVSARERHRRRALSLAAKITKAHHAPKVIRELRANTRAPGEGGTRRSGEARFGVDRDARVGVTFVFDDAARNARTPSGTPKAATSGPSRGARGRRVVPRPAASASRRVSSTDVAGVADGVRGTGRGTASLCASLCVFASAHLCGDERARIAGLREAAMGVLPSLFRAREGGAAGEEGLHAPRVSSLGGDVQRRVARAVRFGDVHVAGDEDGAQISAWPRSAARRRATPRKVDRMAGVTSSGASASRRWRRLSPSPDPAAEMSAARYAPLKPPARAMVTREKTAESRTCRHPDSSRSDATHARADDRDDETRDDETTETTKRPRGTLTRALSRDAPGPRPRARNERHPNPESAFVPPGARMKILRFGNFHVPSAASTIKCAVAANVSLAPLATGSDERPSDLSASFRSTRRATCRCFETRRRGRELRLRFR